MAKRAERFKKAIFNSLFDLQSKGAKINQSEVITNARYEDGTVVGTSTLYKKNANKEFIHKELLTSISNAIKTQNEKSGKPTKEERLSEKSSTIRDLNLRVSSLVDQVVVQEIELRKVNKHDRVDKNAIDAQEAEIYVLSGIIRQLVSQRIGIRKSVIETMGKYQLKNRESEILTACDAEIEEHLKDINSSTIFDFPSDKNGKVC